MSDKRRDIILDKLLTVEMKVRNYGGTHSNEEYGALIDQALAELDALELNEDEIRIKFVGAVAEALTRRDTRGKGIDMKDIPRTYMKALLSAQRKKRSGE